VQNHVYLLHQCARYDKPEPTTYLVTMMKSVSTRVMARHFGHLAHELSEVNQQHVSDIQWKINGHVPIGKLGRKVSLFRAPN
jgi:hypothetical protein